VRKVAGVDAQKHVKSFGAGLHRRRPGVWPAVEVPVT
jgi:hypothetical protein